jgi:hypothetical protein
MVAGESSDLYASGIDTWSATSLALGEELVVNSHSSSSSHTRWSSTRVCNKYASLEHFSMFDVFNDWCL